MSNQRDELTPKELVYLSDLQALWYKCEKKQNIFNRFMIDFYEQRPGYTFTCHFYEKKNYINVMLRCHTEKDLRWKWHQFPYINPNPKKKNERRK